ncbi:MAG: c-type cytochrome [Planctomycetaceae bacterium]|nr:c-type cytochrome [Planctomycetaceae bacterium]
MHLFFRWALGLLAFVGWSAAVSAQQATIPHAQDKPPNEPRDAQTAARMMTVPEGFTVEVVAAEPDLVNPVAMAIDERGRFWITESLEYPRREPGPGRDRVKILEDKDGDGTAETVSIFLDGLNIPSGVQVGHGGVWIANSPDILFVPDGDRDGVPDGPAQVVVTGFGRTDTHELPNSLTWGPDGWLYGLNGVFNHSHVKYAPENPNYEKAGGEKHPGWKLTCAMFRIHPRTREFQVFCEGTSNPWGIAFNDEGDAFVSACVIDHLWHLVETGYYHRQGGPYPPHTWKIESIVKHKHQKAAYCGITWFDSDAYPEQYRKKLYMGNIHGGCLNVDRIERNGSTYAGFGEPDFLTANDAWFMPVVQKTGPDGCLYVLDWYDRYHCYQDANRDPAGIDRLKGRLYRVRYQETPRKTEFDLAASTDEQLIELLGHPNVWMRETAQRLLQERKPVLQQLAAVILDDGKPDEVRLRALWAVLGAHPQTRGLGGDYEKLVTQLLQSPAPQLRAWGIRAIWNDRMNFPIPEVFDAAMNRLITDDSAAVRLQVAIAASHPACGDRMGRLLGVLQTAGDDELLQRIVWQNLHPLLEDRAGVTELIRQLSSGSYLNAPAVQAMVPRLIDRLLARQDFDATPVSKLFSLVNGGPQAHPKVAQQILDRLAIASQTGVLSQEKQKDLKQAFETEIATTISRSDSPLFLDAALLATTWRMDAGFAATRQVLESVTVPEDQRLAAANALIAAGQDEVLRGVAKVFEQSPVAPVDFRGKLLASLARLDDPEVAAFALAFYPQMEADLQPKAIELLTQRPAWAKALLAAIGEGKLSASVININQARRLHETKDADLKELLAKHWGQVREGRSTDRERVIADMRRMIRTTPGDAPRGQAVYKKICAQCHKIHGEGAEVGPDITRNGRNDYTQLLSNVFDPSLVIGSGYRSYTVATLDGRVINGLLAEESPQRVVLKVQGGKQEVIARDDIDVFKVSEISLMPEGIEKQYSAQEIADLFAFLTLDKPPGDPSATRLPGVYDVVPRESTNPDDYGSIFQEVAPGFSRVESGEGGVALLAEFRGRKNVVRTHPVSRDRPARMFGEFAVPAEGKSKLVIEVSHDPRGDWRLVMGAASGGRLFDELISRETTKDGWARFEVSLERFAGQTVELQMWNQANDWAWEFAYWGRVEVVTE